MRTFLCFILLFSFLKNNNAQTIINAYAKVTAVAVSKQLTVSNVNIVNHTFNVGEKVVIMQMQDDVIGGNTGNNSNFGDLSTIANAGVFEIGVIASRSPAAGTPTLITLSTNLLNTFNTGANSSVQIITFRNFGAAFTTTNSITGLAWDGNIGGVVAFEVNGNLILNHSISADYLGFRGGAASNNADENCANGSYRTNDADKSYKGEGIYKSTATTYNNGRGKIINGGGGGSQNNTGGGGGGNFTSGGNGGQGYQCTNANSGYGLGGASLSAHINAGRIFMGGGGGGGQQNNSSGTNGGNGGGILLIKANSILTSTNCSAAIRISANGANPLNSGNDGSGGGGAGGSIIIQAATYSVNGICPLSVRANGGDGGDVTNTAAHGGGGGGGQGAIIYSSSQPTINVTSSTTNGTGGTNNTPATSSASSGSGTNNSGVIPAQGGPLPTEIIHFEGVNENNVNKIKWVTLIEVNNDYYNLERSSDGINFESIGTVKNTGNSSAQKEYEFTDTQPLQQNNYYRVKQNDLDGSVKYSWIIVVKTNENAETRVFPNPVSKEEFVNILLDKKNSPATRVQIFEHTGKLIYEYIFPENTDKNYQALDLRHLSPGIYLLKLDNELPGKNFKLIIR